MMRRIIATAFRALCLFTAGHTALSAEPSAPMAPAVSPETEDCIGCHEQLTPGIVADWRKSRHAVTLTAT